MAPRFFLRALRAATRNFRLPFSPVSLYREVQADTCADCVEMNLLDVYLENNSADGIGLSYGMSQLADEGDVRNRTGGNTWNGAAFDSDRKLGLAPPGSAQRDGADVVVYDSGLDPSTRTGGLLAGSTLSYSRGAPAPDLRNSHSGHAWSGQPVAMISAAAARNWQDGQNAEALRTGGPVGDARFAAALAASPYFGDVEGVEPGAIDYSISEGLRYGKMPPSALTSRWEETNMDSGGEEMMNAHYRSTLRDRRPDDPTLEEQEPRSSAAIASGGLLNLRYFAGRGQLNDPAHPEMFLGLVDREPRGTATDPDFAQYRLQGDARMRFIQFGSGNDDRTVTSGGMREDQIRDAKVQARRMITPRLRIFTTSKDGRRNGLRHIGKRRAAVSVVDKEASYADFIRDWAENPQRKTTVLSNEVMRASKWYFQNTPDHEFLVNRYGADPNNNTLLRIENKYRNADGDLTYSVQDDAICKSVGIVMGGVVSACDKTQGQQEYGLSADAQGRKSAGMPSVESILFDITQDTEFMESDRADGHGKFAGPRRRAHGARTDDGDLVPSAHSYHEAELMYKSVTDAGNDRARSRRAAVGDARAAEAPSDDPQNRRHAAMRADQLRASEMHVNGKNMRTKIYKSARLEAVSGATPGGWTRSDAEATESDTTQVRKLDQKVARIIDKTLLRTTTDMGDNDAMDRWAGGGNGGRGKLRVRRYASREQNDAERIDGDSTA